jgi:hypothetical protein
MPLLERTISTRIITKRGREFRPLNPRVEDVDIRDIAHALSNMCRFNGHVREFYSVAQHSVLVSNLLDDEPEYALWGLLHDATEAYLPDVTRPIKSHIEGFCDIEDRLMAVIAEAFNLFPAWPMPKEVKLADNRLLVTEQRDLCLGYTPSLEDVEPLPEVIEPLEPIVARIRFLQRFNYLRSII